MLQPITVTLPDDVKKTLDELSKKEGVSADVIVGRAIKQRMFLRQFRSLRERMTAKAREQDIFTDQDVFDRVS